MLKARIIPTLLWKDHGLVKGKSFDSWRRVGTVLPAIKVYNTRQVDELILVDIAATRDNRDLNYEEIEEFTSESFVPLTIGGGINNIDQIRKLLACGADKVAINSIAYDNPQLVKEASNAFGVQCIVISIDVKKTNQGIYECFSHSGTQCTGIEVIAHCKEMERLGAGEILITSITNDGLMDGYDIDLIKQVSNSVNIPVIASGGAGNYSHMLKALQGGADAVAAASIYQFTEQTPLEAKNFLQANGIAIRKKDVPFV
jgi:imidazole glycerol-phosphate synthase subunit HisF